MDIKRQRERERERGRKSNEEKRGECEGERMREREREREGEGKEKDFFHPSVLQSAMAYHQVKQNLKIFVLINITIEKERN